MDAPEGIAGVNAGAAGSTGRRSDSLPALIIGICRPPLSTFVETRDPEETARAVRRVVDSVMWALCSVW